MQRSVNTIVKGSSLRVLANVIGVAVGFFMMPFLVGHMGDRMFGLWALVGTLAGYYGVLDLGIVSAVQYYVAKALGEKDERRIAEVLSTSFYLFTVIGIVVLVVTVVLAMVSSWLVRDPADAAIFRDVLIIVGIGCAISFPGRIFIGALSAHLRWDLITIGSLAIFVLRTGLIILAVLKGYGIVLLAFITVITDIFLLSLYVGMLLKVQPSFYLSIEAATFPVLKEILGYSFYTSIIKASDQLRLYVDGVIVAAFVTVSAVTHYAVASRLAIAFMEFMIALLGILSPWFSQLTGSKDHAAVYRVFCVGTVISASIATIVAGCLLIYGHPFIEVWMGSLYLDSYWALCFLVLGIYCDMSQLTSISYLYGVSQHRFLAYLTLCEGMANVALSVFLVQYWGITGVAVGTFLPMCVARLFVLPVYVSRKLKVPIGVYYGKIYGQAVVLSGLAIAVPWFFIFRWSAEPTVLSIGLHIMAQVLIAVICIYLFVLDAEVKKGIVRVLGIVAPIGASKEPRSN